MASTQENSLKLRLDKRKGTMSEVEMAQFQKQQVRNFWGPCKRDCK